jgi:ethanolamine utilization cobalamin adenosyltransferase
MAAFSRGPEDITARLSDVIEHLQSDSLQDQAELQAALLLKELNRLLTFTPNPVKGESGHWINHAAEAGMDRKKLELVREMVRDGRADILSGDRAIAIRRFKKARGYWMTAATQK